MARDGGEVEGQIHCLCGRKIISNDLETARYPIFSYNLAPTKSCEKLGARRERRIKRLECQFAPISRSSISTADQRADAGCDGNNKSEEGHSLQMEVDVGTKMGIKIGSMKLKRIEVEGECSGIEVTVR